VSGVCAWACGGSCAGGHGVGGEPRRGAGCFSGGPGHGTNRGGSAASASGWGVLVVGDGAGGSVHLLGAWVAAVCPRLPAAAFAVRARVQCRWCSRRVRSVLVCGRGAVGVLGCGSSAYHLPSRPVARLYLTGRRMAQKVNRKGWSCWP